MQTDNCLRNPKFENSSSGSCKLQTDRKASRTSLIQGILCVGFLTVWRNCRRVSLFSGSIFKSVIRFEVQSSGSSSRRCWSSSDAQKSWSENLPREQTLPCTHTHTFNYLNFQRLKSSKFFLAESRLCPLFPTPSPNLHSCAAMSRTFLGWHQEASPSNSDREPVMLGSFSPVGLWITASLSLIREFYFLGQNGAQLSVIHDRQIIILF